MPAATQPATPAWDSFDAYLFDIDGTLLNCTDAVHYFAFCDALSWVAGRPLNLDGVAVHGNTDVGILADALRFAAVDEAVWRPHLPAMQQRMADAVTRDQASILADPLPGVVEVLTHLQSRGALLGVATGNLETIAWAKLTRAGLRDFFRFGGFSNHAHTRPEVFRAAVAQIRDPTRDPTRDLTRARIGDHTRALNSLTASICVVGDTPSDITAAAHNGLPVIAVATGVFSTADLAPHHPTWCVASLTELLATPPA